jgi:DNA repair exonuclease SbcCD ATPase subunit
LIGPRPALTDPTHPTTEEAEMNDMSENPRISMGANNPPITEVLPQKYEDFTRQANELLDAAKKVPARVDDDETGGKVAELSKKMVAVKKTFETAFDGEKAPHNLALTQIGGFFKTWIERLETENKRIKAIGLDYKARKEAAEKKRLEEIAQKKREEQERLEREARDARQTKEAAQQALAEFERLSREADESKASATSEVEQAQAQVAIAEAKLARVKSDNSQMAATLAQRVVDGNAASDEEKQRMRGDAEANLKAARDDLEAARSLLSEARERAKAAKEAARKAEEEAAAKKSEVRTAEREIKAADTEAQRQAVQADKIEKKIEQGDPSMGSVRSVHGALATSMRVWKHEVTDLSLLDKEALWHLIAFDAIETAVGKWAKLQPPERKKMEGAHFWEEDVAVVR